MPRTVLQLGAGALMAHSIRKLREMGMRVLAVDVNPQAPAFPLADAHAPIDIREAGAIADFARENHVDFILALNDLGVLAAAQASRELGLPNLDPNVALCSVHKGKMRQAWQKVGLPQPDFRLADTQDEMVAAAAALGYPLILKPAMNLGSRGVSRVAGPADLAWSIDYAMANDRGGGFIVEQLVPGTETTVEGLVKNGEVQVLAQSDKEPQEHPRYRVAMALNYPAKFEPSQLQRTQEVVAAAARALGIENGAFHCECMINPQGVFLLEMAARPGGGHIFSHIVEAVSGVCMPLALVGIFLGEDPDIRPRRQRGACYRFFAPPPGVFQGASGVEEARRLPGILDLGFSLKAGTVVGPIAGDADRPGYVVSTGAGREEAIANADRAVAQVHYMMTA